MNAIRVHRFGGIDELVYERVARPQPKSGQVLVRIACAGVGPWDAWVRSGESALPQPLPLIPGSDFSGTVEDGVDSPFNSGDRVFGVTNAQFTGAYAEYAVADASMVAHKPSSIGDTLAASLPVVSSTAWQMVHEYGKLVRGQRVLIHGAAGSVGSLALQFAKIAGAYVIATARPYGIEYVQSLGADEVIDVAAMDFEDEVGDLDVVLDTIGGDTLSRSYTVLKEGGILVSAAAPPDKEEASRRGIIPVFFLVSVTAGRLATIAKLVESSAITVRIGELLPLSEARTAHAMLAGEAHRPGKIILTVS
ncbi:MAG TPA: NADP-dependent oxidoreductase [Spirochaetia bacterium]|nr:NADP-dependent oxidoreductase [Spirochaetia bacterium]